MKLRGTFGGLNLLLEPGDTGASVARTLANNTGLLATNVTVEIAGDTHPEALETALAAVRAAGGTLGRVRAPRITVVAESGVATPEVAAAEPTLPIPVNGSAPVSGSAPASAPVPPSPLPQTVIVPQTVRAGFRGEYPGSVVVLGDVNPGAELVAGGDVIVTGALRGLAHAGYGGHENAIVWGRPIASPQLRIGNALARSPEGNASMKRLEGNERSERAYLKNGQIVIEAKS